MSLEHLTALLTPEVLTWMVVGSVVGIILGALPGMGPETGIALFLPLTFSLDPVTALACLGAIYVSGVFGGNITAILINTPGTPDSLFLTWDGYPMTKRGQGGRAIAISTIGAFFGGLIGSLTMLFGASVVAKAAVGLGPLEVFLIYGGSVFGCADDSRSGTRRASVHQQRGYCVSLYDQRCSGTVFPAVFWPGRWASFCQTDNGPQFYFNPHYPGFHSRGCLYHSKHGH